MEGKHQHTVGGEGQCDPIKDMIIRMSGNLKKELRVMRETTSLQDELKAAN